MAKKSNYEWDEDAEADDQESPDYSPVIRERIPAFPVAIDIGNIEVDAPDNIEIESSFKEVQGNDLKIINLALTAQLHALSHIRTPKGLAIITKELRETLNHRRDVFLYQKTKEPTLSGKGGVIVLNPID